MLLRNNSQGQSQELTTLVYGCSVEAVVFIYTVCLVQFAVGMNDSVSQHALHTVTLPHYKTGGMCYSCQFKLLHSCSKHCVITTSLISPVIVCFGGET